MAKPCPATLCVSSTVSPDGGMASSPCASSPSWGGNLGAHPFREPGDLGPAGASSRASRSSTSRSCCTRSCTTRCSSGRHPLAERVLGFLYAVPSGISPSQFTRWHLDHHAELGSDEEDPKRHHLSPKVNARWYKLLYCTPALFPIYFRAARRETVDLRPAAAARASPASAGLDRFASPGACGGLVLLRLLRRPADEHHPGVLHLPDRLHAEPARPALRHRSRPTRRSGAR